MNERTEARYHLPNDAYGRRTELIWRKIYDGKTGFEIVRHAGGQRDDKESVALLTIDQLRIIRNIIARDFPEHTPKDKPNE